MGARIQIGSRLALLSTTGTTAGSDILPSAACKCCILFRSLPFGLLHPSVLLLFLHACDRSTQAARPRGLPGVRGCPTWQARKLHEHAWRTALHSHWGHLPVPC